MDIKDLSAIDSGERLVCQVFNTNVLRLTDGLYGIKIPNKPFVILLDPNYKQRKRDGKMFRKEQPWIAKLVCTAVDNSDNTKYLSFDTEDVLVLSANYDIYLANLILETKSTLDTFLSLSDSYSYTMPCS
jgi:hypothetical protein